MKIDARAAAANAMRAHSRGFCAAAGNVNVVCSFVVSAASPSRRVARVPDVVMTVTPLASIDFFRSSWR